MTNRLQSFSLKATQTKPNLNKNTKHKPKVHSIKTMFKLLLLLLAIVNGSDLQDKLEAITKRVEQRFEVAEAKFKEAQKRVQKAKESELQARVTLAKSKYQKAETQRNEQKMRMYEKEWIQAQDDLAKMMQSDNDDDPQA